MKKQTLAIAFLLVLVPLALAQITQEQKLTANDAQADDEFGSSVGIDGMTIVVGAGTAGGAGDAGAAYVFTRSGSSWAQQAKLVSNDLQNGDHFGQSIAIEDDTVVVGAPQTGVAGKNGAAYVFTRSGSSWTQQAKLVSSDAQAVDLFGVSVDVSGNTVVVGAAQEDSGGMDAGAAYIFTRSGSSWTQQAKLTASDAGAGDLFGLAVAIDDDTSIVGARDEDSGGADAGAAYIFTRSGSSWTQQAKLTASDAGAGDGFGGAVDIDEGTAVIGAPEANAGYVFTGSASQWSQQSKLLPSAGGGEFGASVAIDADVVVISAPFDDNGGSNAGAMFVFARSGSMWAEEAKLIASDAEVNDLLGFFEGVGVNDGRAVVGAEREDSGGTDAGAAYVFSGLPFTPEVVEAVSPEEFDTGLKDILTRIGFATPESQLFFVVFLVGLVTIGAAAATRLISAGRLKNFVLLATQALFAVFGILLAYLDLWMFLVALMIGIFSTSGGSAARNTYHDLIEGARNIRFRQRREDDFMEFIPADEGDEP